jgi:hypothetical protein
MKSTHHKKEEGVNIDEKIEYARSVFLNARRPHIKNDMVTKAREGISGACQAGKQVGAPHHAKNIMTTIRSLKILQIDLFGPIAYISISGNKYGLVIVDNYSHFTWVFFL